MLATYRMFETHNHADKSSPKTEASIPNPPGFGHRQLGSSIEEMVARVNAVSGVVGNANDLQNVGMAAPRGRREE
jgi:hypothetical protein